MCDQSDKITLCTCDDDNEAAATIGPRLTWHLWRRAGSSGIVGRMVRPSNDLGDGVTFEAVLHALNSGNPFDFDYLPADGDSLTIRSTANESVFMTFDYSNERWSEGVNGIAWNWEPVADGTLHEERSANPIQLKKKIDPPAS